MKNLSFTSDEIVTIHRSLFEFQKKHLPFNDHSVDQLLSRIGQIMKNNAFTIADDLHSERNHVQFKVKKCKVNDMLHDLDSWEYQLNHIDSQLSYLNHWLEEIQKTAPCQK
jgi:hypothetical protein